MGERYQISHNYLANRLLATVQRFQRGLLTSDNAISPPAPTPCSTRAVMSTTKLLASPPMREPAKKKEHVMYTSYRVRSMSILYKDFRHSMSMQQHDGGTYIRTSKDVAERGYSWLENSTCQKKTSHRPESLSRSAMKISADGGQSNR
jgi:hypothetical protein